MQLYDPQRHEPLIKQVWSAEAARATIVQISDEAQAEFSNQSLYPAHPRDDMIKGNGGSAHYLGAGGVFWALDYLARRGFTNCDANWLIAGLTHLVSQLPEELSDFPMRGEVSYLFGDLPLLMQLFELTGAGQWREQLVQRFQHSVECPVREIMWGTPGVLIASKLIKDPDLRDELADIDEANITKLLNAWQYDADGMQVWREELYGHHQLFVGPIHGYAGQVLPLLQRLESLDAEVQGLVLTRSKTYLQATAMNDNGLTNWPAAIGLPADETHTGLVQYCHGAPGMVISYCTYPKDPEVDALLVQGGELIWQAGPLAKGANICHGTAGNGYAFLALYQRTQEPKWLERARAFAMHAIHQYKTERAEIGFQRYSLWTGDPGLAVFLADCIDGTAQLPTIEVF